MSDRSLALIVGANRGIGLGVVREFLARDWSVVATARRPDAAAELAALRTKHGDRLEVLPLDMSAPEQIDGFAATMKGRTFDSVLVNAGVAGPSHRSANAATPEETGQLMFVNAIGPTRLGRLLLPNLRSGSGVLAFTSSLMGSVALNAGGHELYRASKAALNSLSRGLYSEMRGKRLTLLTLHPGWVRTDMGGSGAPVRVEESARGMVDEMIRASGSGRHAFVDWQGKEIAW